MGLGRETTEVRCTHPIKGPWYHHDSSLMLFHLVPIHSLLLPAVFHCLEIPCFINLSAHGHLMYFHFLAIGNHATMNIYVPIFVWTHIFHSFGYLLGGGITGSYSYSVLNVLRNFQNLCSVHNILHPPSQQCLRVQFPHILISTYCFLSFG